MSYVDFRVLIPPKEQFSALSEQAAPAYMENYIKMFGIDLSEWVQYIGVPELLAEMDRSGVDLAVVHAEMNWGHISRELNEAARASVAQAPDRLVGVVTIDPEVDPDPVAVLREARKWGAVGLNIQGWVYQRRINDPYFYPAYDYLQKHDMILFSHTAVNYSTDRYIEYSRPVYLDMIACDFPKLKIVAMHGGWPWVNELCAVCWKHSNVYFEFGGHRPKYLINPGSGWETLFNYGRKILSGQMLYATEWPMLDMKRGIDEIREFWPLSDAVKEGILGKNGLRLLGRL
ncbi:MAG: amidohydrolase family protein [Bacillota bacterium]